MKTEVRENRQFTVSSRKLGDSWFIYSALKTRFEQLNIGKINQVVSVFGFTKTYSPLYGGRPFRRDNGLSVKQIKTLSKKNIGFSLTLSNHFFSEDAYRQTIPLLEALYDKKNSIVCANDDLARQIRADFPDFTLHASVVKEIRDISDIHQALELYDFIVFHPKLNDDVAFLQSIDCRDKIILFATIHCLYKCDEKDCFLNVSEVNRDESAIRQNNCPHRHDPEFKKLTVFDLHDYRFDGYRYFKVVL